jgi:hypothetical protein
VDACFGCTAAPLILQPSSIGKMTPAGLHPVENHSLSYIRNGNKSCRRAEYHTLLFLLESSFNLLATCVVRQIVPVSSNRPACSQHEGCCINALNIGARHPYWFPRTRKLSRGEQAASEATICFRTRLSIVLRCRLRAFC